MGFPLITKEIGDAVAAMVDRWENPPLFQDVAWSMNMRVYRAMERLARYGLNLDVEDLNFADICQFSEKDLLRIHRFGRKSLEELQAKLSEFGWKLADKSHSREELNSRFRSGNAPGWWDWDDGYISPQDRLQDRLRAAEAYKEWLERCAAEAAQPKLSIPTDPEAYNKWRLTGEGLIEHPPSSQE